MMKKIFSYLIIFGLILTILNPLQVEAKENKKPKLNITNSSIQLNDTLNIKLLNASKKVKFTIENKNKVKVIKKNSNSIKIKALKTGKVTIKCKYKNKTYTCKIKIVKTPTKKMIIDYAKSIVESRGFTWCDEEGGQYGWRKISYEEDWKTYIRNSIDSAIKCGLKQYWGIYNIEFEDDGIVIYYMNY